MTGLIGTAEMSDEKEKSKMAQIFDEYYALMMHIAFGILKDRAWAEDAVSESLEKLIKNISIIGAVSCYKTKSLIVIIVKNTSLNLLKMKNRTAVIDDEHEGMIDEDSLIPEKLVSMEGFENLEPVFIEPTI